MTDPSDKYWRTPDIYLAAFLYARGAIIVGVEKIEGKPMYSFVDSAERRLWHTEYHAGKPLVDVRIYVYALRDLLGKSRQSLRQNPT